MASEPVERYAAEAADARHRIAGTIDAIQERLDPRRIMNEAVGKVQGGSEKLLVQARATAKDHPLAIGAAAAAIGLALLARNRLSKARVDLGDAMSDYTDYDDGFGFLEQDDVQSGADFADVDKGDRSAATRRRAATAKARASAAASRATASVGNNPLVSIMVGLAAGAALGALFPATETEQRAFAATSGRVAGTARDA